MTTTSRGCLLGCLAPAVLLLIGLLLARPMLTERWSRWRAENPWVAQVLGAAAVLKEVAGGDEAAGVTAGDSAGGARRASEPREGVNDKAAMPADLPAWPRSLVETFSVGEGHAAAYQRVSAPADSVLRYFRAAMPAKGWRLGQEREGAGGVLLLFRKGDRIARVEVVADTGGTDLWLRSRTTGPGR